MKLLDTVCGINLHKRRKNSSSVCVTTEELTEYGTRVVTDIDDTVKSSGGLKIFGIAIGGVDIQYKRGSFYPGAFQFAFELSNSTKMAVNPIPPKIAVLTARAKEFKFALALKPEDKLCSAYRFTGKKNGISNWGVGNVYYGSVVEWIFQNRKGLRKFKNFELLMGYDAKMNKVNNYILIGDTGEKDEDCGERIALRHPKAIKAIFLHTVSDKHDRTMVTVPKDRVLNGVPIYYFRTYVNAAMKAYQENLISSDAVKRVINAARLELNKSELLKPNKLSIPKSAKKTVIQNYLIQTRRRELEMDIREAQAFLNFR